MKTINVTFENKEHEELQRKKGDMSWHDWIIKLSQNNKEDLYNGR